MAGLDNDKFGEMLKNYYRQYPMSEWMFNQESPLLAKIKKIKWGGKQVVQPVIYGLPAGRSRNFATADAKAKKGDFVAGEVTFKMDKDYSIFRVEGQVIASSELRPYAYAKALETQSNLQLKALVNNRCTALYGGGTGERGKISAIDSARTTITLTDRHFHMNIGLGMELVFSATTSGGSLRAGGPVTVTSIDRTAKKVTVTPALNAAVVDDDNIFQNGDYIASSSTDIIMDGLEKFLPDTVASNDNFRGLNRSKDRERLAGTIFTQKSSTTIEDTILDACAELGQNGGRVDCLFINPLKFNDFVQELGSRVRYNRDEIRKTPIGRIGFRSLEIDSAGAKAGIVRIYSDPYCPRNRGYAFDMSMPEIYYLGEGFIFLDKIDGNKYLRDLGGDEVQGRHKSYANLHFPRPLDSLKIKFLT